MTTPRELIAQYASASQLSSFFIDKMGIVNVKSYGAKGDGATDDTEAIQDAIDTGKDVYFPMSGGEIYLITAQITVSTDRQRIYSDIKTPRSMEGTTTKGQIKFTQTGESCILVTSVGVTFEGLSFNGVDRTTYANTCIEFAKTSNTDDMDGYVRNCFFYQFANAVAHYGRGLHFENNTVATCNYGISYYWPSTGVVADSTFQNLPYGHRALRVTDNRFHDVNVYAVQSNNETLRGALITGNTLDIGDGLLRVMGDIENSIISDNIVEFSEQTIIRLWGNVTGVVITDNVFAGAYNSTADTPSSVLAISTTAATTITDLSFNNNRIHYTNSNAILFEVAAAGVSMCGNSFRSVGLNASTNNAILKTRDVTGMSFVGNSCYPVTAPYVMKTNSSTNVWTQVIAQHNNYTAPSSFSYSAYVDGGGNVIQT